MKKLIPFIPIALFAVLLGCGGGGGGGGGGNGSTNATTGFTSGDLGADPSSTLLGQVVNESNGGISGVTIKFFTSGGTQVGTAVSRPTGYFDANLPTSATRCEVDGASFPSGNGVLKQYRYNGKAYQNVMTGLSCNRILLPGIVTGVLTPMATAMVYYPAGGPPPFPDGCF